MKYCGIMQPATKVTNSSAWYCLDLVMLTLCLIELTSRATLKLEGGEGGSPPLSEGKRGCPSTKVKHCHKHVSLNLINSMKKENEKFVILYCSEI